MKKFTYLKVAHVALTSGRLTTTLTPFFLKKSAKHDSGLSRFALDRVDSLQGTLPRLSCKNQKVLCKCFSTGI